ncbi:MAG TPA: rod shape-determining protein MreC [Defluviitaleaceae bacterium]|nr:rod shape-determining protein MreC [Candidatus Epulonipiscium sp.]HOQ16120.1 rod shape-determining protein MreC [Defluviitaleaceae bacterium]HPT76875.1 rod shape-determining protein MreC [Defluviitaleaceae bacterium]HQD51408.1 rod shape-determining protein MreC [Defluviitaleaceae bacterium]
MRRSFKIKEKYVIVIVTIVLLITIILTAGKRYNITFIEKGLGYIVMPVQKTFSSVGEWISDQIYFIKNIKELEKQNTELAKKVDELSYENKILQQYKDENTRLRKLLELDKKYPDYPKIGAEIIGKDPGNWYNVFLIDKGSNDGLEVDMVVLSGNGLVGHIIEVAPNYSKVLSIIDDRNAVSSKVLRTGDLGIVKGDLTLLNEGLCKMEYVDAEADIIVGDEIVTSNLSDIYPPGIMIGVVKEIETESHGLTKYALIEPVVDFRHLEEVLVINMKWNKKDDATKE